MTNQILHKNETLTLELVGIKIEKTYRNLLCGLPTKQLNKIIVSNEIEDTSLFSESENVFCVEPTEIKMPLEMDYKQGEPYKLPNFVYKAKIISYSPNNDLMNFDTYYFEFGLLWFDDNFSIEIPQNIIEYAKSKIKM